MIPKPQNPKTPKPHDYDFKNRYSKEIFFLSAGIPDSRPGVVLSRVDPLTPLFFAHTGSYVASFWESSLADISGNGPVPHLPMGPCSLHKRLFGLLGLPSQLYLGGLDGVLGRFEG